MGTLNSVFRSRGLRVTWGAAELGIDIDLEMLPFPPRVCAPDFLSINPLGTVPAYVEDGMVMTESTAILHYLAVRAGPSDLVLAPEHPEYGLFLDFLHHADATLTVPQTVYIRFVRQETALGLEEAGHAYAHWFAARLIKLDQHLADRDYLCAGRFTIADIAVGYALYLSTMIGLSDHLTPRLRAYLDRLIVRPAFVGAVQREQDADTLREQASPARREEA